MYWAVNFHFRKKDFRVWLCPMCQKDIELDKEVRIIKRKHTYMCIHLTD